MSEDNYGIKIKGYQIHLPPLGEGAYGRVYRATYRGISDRALKIFRPDAVDLSTMSRELEKISSVAEHHGIVTLHDFDLLHDPPYYAMGLHANQNADGIWETRTLEQLCGHVDHREAWRLIREIADALAYLHRNQIIHCDVKPSNILLTDETPFGIKICDFGQSRGLSGDDFNPAGTPLYASPEQLSDPRDSADGKGFRWDVYSFGVVAYKLLTGNLPRLQALAEAEKSSGFDPESTVQEASLEATLSESSTPIDGEQLATMTEAIEEIEWPDDFYIPSARKEIIELCLSLDPRKRPADMRDVWNRIKALDQQRVMRRARQLNAIFATLLVIAIWASGFAFIQAKRARDANVELKRQTKNATDLAMPFVTELLDGEITVERIYAIIGDNAEAFLESLPTDDRKSEKALRISAQSASIRGRQALESGDLEEALAKYTSAYEIRSQLAKNNEGQRELAFLASRDLMQIGKIQELKEDYPAAEKAYSEALEIRKQRESAETEEPSISVKLRELLRTYQALSRVQYAQGKADEAIETLEEIYQAYQKHLETAPPAKGSNYGIDIIRILNSLGEIQYASGELDDASKTYQDLQSIADNLQSGPPSTREEARSIYINSLNALGRIQKDQKQPEAALFLFKREIAMRDDDSQTRPYDPYLKLALAEAYAMASSCLPTDDQTSRLLALYYLDEAIGLVSHLPSELRNDEDTQEKVMQFNQQRSDLLELDE